MRRWVVILLLDYIESTYFRIIPIAIEEQTDVDSQLHLLKEFDDGRMLNMSISR